MGSVADTGIHEAAPWTTALLRPPIHSGLSLLASGDRATYGAGLPRGTTSPPGSVGRGTSPMGTHIPPDNPVAPYGR